MRKIACLFPIAILVLWYGVSPATIINVTADYSTVQAAIDNCPIGDTVRVEPGTYIENINFGGKNIVVGSWFLDAGDPSYISSTIIDGNNDIAVSFTNGENNSAVIKGFTIRNGFAMEGGGIFCDNNSDPTISYNIVSGNTSYNNGGGICCKNSSDPVISNNTVSGNAAMFQGGGGIYCFFSDPTISHNIITGNSGDLGGGIWCDDDSHPTINNNTISGNSAGLYGGGIYCGEYTHPTITSTIFWDNSASSGPEIYLDNSSPVIAYCDIQDTLWTGTGNISCDPMFCEPDSGNFYLADSSCCIGVGQGGADIGALGIGCGSPTIPTLSEWGLLIMALLLLTAGTVGVVRRRKIALNR